MSMKSFDKFCERIILAEPGSQKEIFDERQRQQRTQLTVEALRCVGTVCFTERGFRVPGKFVFWNGVYRCRRFSLVEHSRACKGVSVRRFWEAGDL